MAAQPPLLSVTPIKDGLWSVNEREPGRVAIAYFPSKWGALKHALKAAKARPRARIAILRGDGAVEASREYAGPNAGPKSVEVP